MNYKIANLTNSEFNVIKKAEEQIKNETGKDFVMIAWKKEN